MQLKIATKEVDYVRSQLIGTPSSVGIGVGSAGETWWVLF